MTTQTRTLPQNFARFRRLRRSGPLRDLVAETRLSPRDFIYPLFVAHGENVRAYVALKPAAKTADAAHRIAPAKRKPASVTTIACRRRAIGTCSKTASAV